MTIKTKGRSGCNQATPKTSICAFYSTSIVHCMKAVIVTLALWGWFPMCLAKWFNNHGGKRND